MVILIRALVICDIRLQIMTPPHERRNFSQIYEKLPLSTLSARIPAFNFTQYLHTVLPATIGSHHTHHLSLTSFSRQRGRSRHLRIQIFHEADSYGGGDGAAGLGKLHPHAVHPTPDQQPRQAVSAIPPHHTDWLTGLRRSRTSCTGCSTAGRKCLPGGNSASHTSMATSACRSARSSSGNTSTASQNKT